MLLGMATPRESGGGAGVGNRGPEDQQQQIDSIHDGAPAGPFFSESELPSIAVPGGTPMTLGGYSPDPSRTPQISIADDPRGVGSVAPSGVRR